MLDHISTSFLEDRRQVFEMLGYAVAVLAKSPATPPRPCSYLPQTIVPAIEQGRIKFYFNLDGVAVGFVIWVYLDEQSEEQVLRNLAFPRADELPLHGDSLWIIECVAPVGNLRYVLADLRDRTFRRRQSVRYLRTKGSTVLAKEAGRDSYSHFFRVGQNVHTPWRCGHANCNWCQ